MTTLNKYMIKTLRAEQKYLANCGNTYTNLQNELEQNIKEANSLKQRQINAIQDKLSELNCYQMDYIYNLVETLIDSQYEDLEEEEELTGAEMMIDEKNNNVIPFEAQIKFKTIHK